MDQSLSIVLPVYNAQSRLAAQVHELLEVLPDIAPQFEVLIVDDGSSDQTDEIAHELAREYPQLKAVRHSQRLGEPAVVRTGVQHTSGDVVLVHNGGDRLNMGEMRKLCRPAARGRFTDVYQPPANPS